MSRGKLSVAPMAPSPVHLEQYAKSLGLSRQAGLVALARAIAVSASRLQSQNAVLVVRESSPVLALFGVLDETDQISALLQTRAVEHSCGHLRYMNFPQVLQACGRLAGLLTERIGPAGLKEARFAAIPRGGLVILGLLAPLLGLSEEHFLPADHPDQLLVLVDDCAISGTRFRQFVARQAGPRIVFVTLLSPPGLRSAIESREPRVWACLSAEDLVEIPSSPSPEQEERRRQRIERGDSYWLGSTEPLCFPWNEPDRTLWNPARGQYERAWRIVPPELCLKNRTPPGRQAIPVQLQPEARGPLRPAHQVLFAEIDGDVAVCSREDGRIFRLEGTAAGLWRGIVSGGNLEAAIAAVAGELDAPEAVLREDAQRFVEDLLTRGLLIEAEN